MNAKHFLTVTAAVEVGAGLAFLVAPAPSLALLLAVAVPSPELLFIARLAGSALLAIGVGSWVGRGDGPSAGRLGLMTVALVYDVIVAGLLAHAVVAFPAAAGVPWAGVALHVALAVWGVACVRATRR